MKVQWQVTRPHNVKTNLPARDPDLIEFLGREKSLTELRTWISDLKAPVRLITGIGGLGKTTLAYRFAEEVVETKVPSVEWVVWVTAKERTYSALKDQIVATGKVDFTDIVSLYQVILKVLAHEFPMGEDEPDVDDLMDRVVEALSHLSCLIVVDDVDSLQPDQQRAVVSALNGILCERLGETFPLA
jgi:Cdc6-like AAA superfamily ATPase